MLGKTEFVWGMMGLLHNLITATGTGQSTVVKTHRKLRVSGVGFSETRSDQGER